MKLNDHGYDLVAQSYSKGKPMYAGSPKVETIYRVAELDLETVCSILTMNQSSSPKSLRICRLELTYRFEAVYAVQWLQ